jgi:lysine biosynthesis protein LysW
MPKTFCPNCDEEFSIGKPKLGAVVTCKECGESLEVISVEPLEVDFLLESSGDEDEDLDDDE